MTLSFLSLGLSLEMSAPLHERVCGHFRKVSKTVRGGFVSRGFESLETVRFSARGGQRGSARAHAAPRLTFRSPDVPRGERVWLPFAEGPSDVLLLD
jgi:hypothetical protein